TDGIRGARVRVLLVLVGRARRALVAVFLLLVDVEALGRVVAARAARAAGAVDDLDAGVTERGEPRVDLIGRDHVLGHVVVDLVVGDEALLLAQLDQLRAHAIGVAAAVLLAARRALGLGLHRGRVGLAGGGARRLLGDEVLVVVVAAVHVLVALARLVVVERAVLALRARALLGRLVDRLALARRLDLRLSVLGVLGVLRLFRLL